MRKKIVYADFLGPFQEGWGGIGIYLVVVHLQCRFPDLYPLRGKDGAVAAVEDYCLRYDDFKELQATRTACFLVETSANCCGGIRSWLGMSRRAVTSFTPWSVTIGR